MKRLRTLFDAKLWKFLLVGVLNTLVGTGIMFGLYMLANAAVSTRDNVAMLVGMVLFTGLNYLGQRFFAFRSPKTEEK